MENWKELTPLERLIKYKGAVGLVLLGIVSPVLGLRVFQHGKSIGERSFNAEAINQYKSDADFFYDLEQSSDSFMPGLIELILGVLQKILSKIGAGWLEVLFYLIIAITVFLLARAIFKGGFNTVISGKKKIPSVDFELLSEEIDPVDLMELINKASTNGNYKTAIRLWYLYLVKNLSNKSLIVWKKDKTNVQYLRELEGEETKTAFKKITRLYEYVWFGDFVVDQQKFLEIEASFRHFNNHVSKIK